MLKMKTESADLTEDLVFETAGGAPVGLGGERKGVAGERCVASTLLEKREWMEEKEPRFEGPSASAINGWIDVLEGRWWGSSADSSVCCSSPTASSSTTTPGAGLLAGPSDSVNPL